MKWWWTEGYHNQTTSRLQNRATGLRVDVRCSIRATYYFFQKKDKKIPRSNRIQPDLPRIFRKKDAWHHCNGRLKKAWLGSKINHVGGLWACPAPGDTAPKPFSRLQDKGSRVGIWWGDDLRSFPSGDGLNVTLCYSILMMSSYSTERDRLFL